MRAKVSLLCAAAFWSGLFVAAARAEFVVYDDFPGSSLDTGKWTTILHDAQSTITVANSMVALQGGNGAEIASTLTTTYGEFIYKIGNSLSPGNGGFGLSLHGGDQNRILLRNDLGGGWKFEVTNRGNVADSVSVAMTPLSAGDEFKFVWEAGSASVYKKPVGGTEFNLLATRTDSVPSLVSIYVIPEPSMCVMLLSAMAGLMVYAWRKHRS